MAFDHQCCPMCKDVCKKRFQDLQDRTKNMREQLAALTAAANETGNPEAVQKALDAQKKAQEQAAAMKASQDADHERMLAEAAAAKKAADEAAAAQKAADDAAAKKAAEDAANANAQAAADAEAAAAKKAAEEEAARKAVEAAAIEKAKALKAERQDAAEMEAAAAAYNVEYQARMKKASEEADFEAMQGAKTFIGFGLAEMADHLVVDSCYIGGPADQVKVDPGDRIVALGTSRPKTLGEFREALGVQCVCGKLTKLELSRDGNTEHANLWIMTSDKKFEGKPYFFDTANAEKKHRAPSRRGSVHN